MNINKIRLLEERRRDEDPAYTPRVRISIVTARGAPAHERAVNSLREWGVTAVSDAFFLGGIEKSTVLEVLKPHIFFDDQRRHLVRTVPCVHIPYGVTNEEGPATER